MVFRMAKDSTPPAGPGAEPVEQLNALIPVSVKRRIKIAAVNQGKTMTDLLLEWIDAGLTAIEGGTPEKSGRKPR